MNKDEMDERRSPEEYDALNVGLMEEEMGIYTPEFEKAEREMDEELALEPMDPDYIVTDEQAAVNERDLLGYIQELKAAK